MALPFPASRIRSARPAHVVEPPSLAAGADYIIVKTRNPGNPTKATHCPRDIRMSAAEYEVEQKYRVEDLDAVSQRLCEMGANSLKEVQQIDTYFAHPQRSFAETDEAFRMRRIDQVNLLTYKGPRLDSSVKTRREIELPIGEGPLVAEQFRQMVVALGFRIVADVKKRRRCLELSWRGFSVECALDSVEQVGDFVELEIATAEANLIVAQAAIGELAAAIELSHVEYQSYLEMLLQNADSDRG